MILRHKYQDEKYEKGSLVFDRGFFIISIRFFNYFYTLIYLKNERI